MRRKSLLNIRSPRIASGMNPALRSSLLIWLIISTFLLGCERPPTNPHVAAFTDDVATPLGERPNEAEIRSAKTPASSPEVAPADQLTSESAGPVSAKTEAIKYTVLKSVTPPPSPTIPPVLLSASHRKLCRVDVGESFPELSLPRLGGPTTALSSLRGKQATVVLFWHPDRWMARTALIDMQRDIASKFAAENVAVAGIAVRQTSGSIRASLDSAKATFPQLLDTDAKAFAAVGSYALPRIYILDPAGKVVWFDIEYSEGTRRELRQTLAVLTKQ